MRPIVEQVRIPLSEAAAAIAETVFPAQMAAAEDAGAPGVLGTLQRGDRAWSSVERWVFLILAVGGPFVMGIYLLLATELYGFGIASIVLSGVVWGIVKLSEKTMKWLGGKVDAKTTPWIAMAGARRMLAAMEEGRVPVLQGAVRLTLDGDRLEATDGSHQVLIPSLQTSWQAATADYLVVAPTAPSLKMDFAALLVLPAGSEIANAAAAHGAR